MRMMAEKQVGCMEKDGMIGGGILKGLNQVVNNDYSDCTRGLGSGRRIACEGNGDGTGNT